ncbi:GFA family protein [Prosthecomicrobium sp. N25]|uniref:GFA family protein n=1 Tax=Prosthecomicrobium sp. N25 TaxID=3129254 RepID=UPI00307694E9
MTATPLTGGCQCGAVRFRAASLGRASICHCRMCQKAFGSFFGPLVTAHGLVWTRGEPACFRSSNKVRRGFCAACGTPLTYEPDGFDAVEIAIGAFDDPAAIRPAIQLGTESRVPWFHELADLPGRPPGNAAAIEAFFAGLVSFQHPDHDTASPPAPTGEKEP